MPAFRTYSADHVYTVVEALDELALRLRGRLHEQLRGRDELPGLRRQQVAAPNKLVVVADTYLLTLQVRKQGCLVGFERWPGASKESRKKNAKNDFFDGSPKEKDNMLLSLFPFHNFFQIFFVFLYNKYCDNTISTTYKFLIRIRIFDFLPSNTIHNSNTSFLQRILRRM